MAGYADLLWKPPPLLCRKRGKSRLRPLGGAAAAELQRRRSPKLRLFEVDAPEEIPRRDCKRLEIHAEDASAACIRHLLHEDAACLEYLDFVRHRSFELDRRLALQGPREVAVKRIRYSLRENAPWNGTRNLEPALAEDRLVGRNPHSVEVVEYLPLGVASQLSIRRALNVEASEGA